MLALLIAAPAFAQDPMAADQAGGCDGFSRDVSRELALLGGKLLGIDADSDASRHTARIDADVAYTVRLAPQSDVTLTIPPRKTWPDAGHFSGLLTFQVPTNGRYRVSVSSRMWIEVVDAGVALPTLDFEGGHTCPRLRKTVEFELASGRDLRLQLSGSERENVLTLITAVNAAGL